ncbi:hypothetical protein AAG570_012267 [Ranatra chinensis]|uniref:NUDE domain-containing protein n=1 Tax=Ranatra chinensis TaxID=642074 RepID=A0ABD0YKD9_9HEMI
MASNRQNMFQKNKTQETTEKATEVMAETSGDLVSHWKNKTEELERELEEFRESSQMYERELESSLEQADKTIKELRLRNNALQLENDTLKSGHVIGSDKYDELQQATEAQVSELETETAQWHKREEDYVRYIRELEQKNDDLERSQRALYMSVGDFESKLNSALERNVLLESELDDKEILQTMVQRLKDEARDLKQEIQIRDRGKELDNDKSTRRVDLNKLAADLTVQPQGQNSMPNLKSVNQTTNVNLGLTPPTRISAMNIVGDLLRKVGALESKLASCRGTSRESMSPGDLREPYRLLLVGGVVASGEHRGVHIEAAEQKGFEEEKVKSRVRKTIDAA